MLSSCITTVKEATRIAACFVEFQKPSSSKCIGCLSSHPLLPKLGLELGPRPQSEGVVDQDVKPALLRLDPFKEGLHLEGKSSPRRTTR